MMVKDEADIIGPLLEHLGRQVDEVILADNGSTDGTREIAAGYDFVDLRDDPEPAYLQSQKMTNLAHEAGLKNHAWVIPCDADEVWYAPDGRTLSQYLGGVPPDVQIISAELFNHIPSGLDDKRSPLPKVCARPRRDLKIAMGNHKASIADGPSLTAQGLVIRHFSWRSREQYLHKIRTGERAYALTKFPESVGAHWRMFVGHDDETVLQHFDRWFFIQDPYADPTLIYDPAPIS